jgi:hypothetical protein
MEQIKLKQDQGQTTSVALLFILFLGGIFSSPFYANAQRGLSAQVMGPYRNTEMKGEGKEVKTTQSNLLPVLSVEKVKYGTVVKIEGGSVPGLVMDIWCYEDNLGNPANYEKEGNTIVLIHKWGTVTVTSRFEPGPDGVDIFVVVKGPNTDEVKRIRNLNPCCQLERSPSFQNQGDYVEDFVSRCFVYLESGMTLLKDTKRIPGTVKGEEKSNLPKPWIQEYYPAWRKHPGQIQGERGYSTDRPVYPIIGAISRDRKYLAAIAWPEAGRLGQVWHDCVHPRPIIGESFNATTGEIRTHGKIYLMENDGKKLISMFKKDFPEWKRPPNEK